MSARILVINPNSSVTVTDDIARAVDGLRFEGGPSGGGITRAAGPPRRATQRLEIGSAHD